MEDRTRELQRWSQAPAAAYDPRERLNAMDQDGVDRTVLYPTLAGVGGQIFGRIPDAELELACVQAYNDWLIEEWASTSDRFVPLCLAPIASIETTTSEIERAVGRGHRGVVFPAIPMELRDVPHLCDAYWDPLWATCAHLGVPICLHAGASTAIQPAADERLSPKVAEAYRAITRPASQLPVWAHFLMSGILLRHPHLRVVFAESSLGWAAFALEHLDYQFNEIRPEGFDLLPSEMFHRQCYLTSWYDQAGIRTRHVLGVDNILWSTNFPLTTSSWPDTKDFIARSFQGVLQAERDQILWKNAARLFGLDQG